MLIRGAQVNGVAPLDVRLARGRIEAIGPGLARAPGEELVEARGGALLPGLVDHHAHLLSLAAALGSVRCGPPEVRDAAALGAALRRAPGRGWIRGIGYHESVAGDLDRARLDAWAPGRPVRIQHRSGALWILSSGAIERLRLDAAGDVPGLERDCDGRPTGRLYRLDAWLRDRIGERDLPDLAPVGHLLAGFGVTAVTDATATNGPAELHALVSAVDHGALRQRLRIMGGHDLPDPAHPRVARGPVKLVLDESALPAPASFEDDVRRAHAAGRPVAVHCVTRAELVFALEGIAAARPRPGDRIEHAAVAPPELVARTAALGLTVVTQPGFIRERGDDYAREVDPHDRPWLYRARAFLDAGVSLLGGSDAPFGSSNPWLAIRAATDRRSESGLVLGAGESLDLARALALFAPARALAPGEPGDLCLLEKPWRGEPPTGAERATAIFAPR